MKIPEMEESVLPWIGKTAKMMAIFIGDRLKRKGMDLSLQQMIILKILHEEDGRPQQDLAIVTERHKASLTRLISTLEKKQLVTRVPDQVDKRINRVYLTKAEGTTSVYFSCYEGADVGDATRLG